MTALYLVEDNATQSQAARIALEDAGFRVTTHPSAHFVATYMARAGNKLGLAAIITDGDLGNSEYEKGAFLIEHLHEAEEFRTIPIIGSSADPDESWKSVSKKDTHFHRVDKKWDDATDRMAHDIPALIAKLAELGITP